MQIPTRTLRMYAEGFETNTHNTKTVILSHILNVTLLHLVDQVPDFKAAMEYLGLNRVQNLAHLATANKFTMGDPIAKRNLMIDRINAMRGYLRTNGRDDQIVHGKLYIHLFKTYEYGFKVTFLNKQKIAIYINYNLITVNSYIYIKNVRVHKYWVYLPLIRTDVSYLLL